MKVELKIQKDKLNTLYEEFSKKVDKNPKKMYLFYGTLKENGLNIIENSLSDLKSTELYVVVGIDKKNTTKIMLESLLRYTENVYVYNNNSEIEFDSNISLFEYDNEATLIVSPSNLSEGGIFLNKSMYFVINYSFDLKKDKEDYLKTITELKLNIDKAEFLKLNHDEIDKLITERKIFTTKQYIHNVKSISELLGKDINIGNNSNDSKLSSTEENDIYGNVAIPKIDLSDDLIDIELPENEDMVYDEIQNDEELYDDNNFIQETESDEVNIKDFDETQETYNNDMENIQDLKYDDEELEDFEFDENSILNIEDLLFDKADVELNVDDVEKIKLEDASEPENKTIKVKKINIENVSNLLIELDSKDTKNKDNNNIIIPNYIKESIPKFFELNDNAKTISEDGKTYKVRNIKLEIIDVKNNQKYMDRSAKLVHRKGQSFIKFVSEYFENIDFITDQSLARIIKLSSDIYHIEIISKDLQEYNVWNKLCNQTIKNSNMKYGIM